MAHLALALAVLLAAQPQDGPLRKTGKAAQINKDIITWDEIYSRFSTFKPDEVTETLLRAELVRQAEELLFEQKAKELGIIVTERETDEAVGRLIQNYPGGKEAFDQYLRVRNQTSSEHRESVQKELLRHKLTRYLIEKSYRDPGKDPIPLFVQMVSPAEIREYYNAHKESYRSLQHCTVFRIALQWRTEEERKFKRRLAESLRRKLDKGTNPEMLALSYPDIVRQSGSDGRPDFMIRELKRDNTFFTAETTKYLFETLSKGTFSPVLEDGKTFNLFLLLERVIEPEKTFEEAQIKIRSELENAKSSENRRRLRDELLKKAYVEPADLFQ